MPYRPLPREAVVLAGQGQSGSAILRAGHNPCGMTIGNALPCTVFSPCIRQSVRSESRAPIVGCGQPFGCTAVRVDSWSYAILAGTGT
jgi:hypothetical protein